MLSYKIPEAIELLATKLKNAEVSLQSLQDDLEFLREQITVREVNTARSYNQDVVRRKGQGAKELPHRPGNTLPRSCAVTSDSPNAYATNDIGLALCRTGE